MRILRMAAIIGAAAFVVIQFVPYGWWHENPPVVQDTPWPNARSEQVARVSCYDCHSNESKWPVYSYVAPMSWLVHKDVAEGRDELNFSEWPLNEKQLDDAVDVVEDDAMPPSQYTLIHRNARLTPAEAQVLIAALEALGGSGDDRSGPGRSR
jgi:hypothetical protein